MALQKALEGSGSAGRAGLSNHFKISKKQKTLSVRKRFWFPPAVVQGLRRVARWALLFLASRFASPPYKPQGLVALRGFPGGAALCPIREGAP